MEMRSCDEHGRRLTLVLSALALPSYLLSAIALQHLPSDPLSLAFNFSLYSIWAAAMSLLGLIGVLRASPILVTIFSHHLLLDALISTLPRILLIPASTALPSALCAGVDYQRSLLSPRDAQHALSFWTAGRCSAALWVIQIIVGLLVVAVTGVQWWCAVRVRGYAWALEVGVEGQRRMVETGKRGDDLEEGRVGGEKRKRRVRFADEVVVEKGDVVFEEDRRRI